MAFEGKTVLIVAEKVSDTIDIERSVENKFVAGLVNGLGQLGGCEGSRPLVAGVEPVRAWRCDKLGLVNKSNHFDLTVLILALRNSSVTGSCITDSVN